MMPPGIFFNHDEETLFAAMRADYQLSPRNCQTT